MARMLFGVDVCEHLLPLVKSGLMAVGGCLLSKVWSKIMPEPKKCLTTKCMRLSVVNKRGLCLVCYSKAKSKVDNGDVTWDRLVHLGLCESEGDPFDDAYARATEGH